MGKVLTHLSQHGQRRRGQPLAASTADSGICGSPTSSSKDDFEVHTPPMKKPKKAVSRFVPYSLHTFDLSIMSLITELAAGLAPGQGSAAEIFSGIS